MKHLLILIFLLFITAKPAVGASDPICFAYPYVNPSLGPDWIFVRLTNLDVRNSYLVTLTEPDGTILENISDYHQTYNISTFGVVTFQSGTYVVTLATFNHNRPHTLSTTCQVAI